MKFNRRGHLYPETYWVIHPYARDTPTRYRQEIKSGGGVIIRKGKIEAAVKPKERVTDRIGARAVFAPFHRAARLLKMYDAMGAFSEYIPRPGNHDGVSKFEELVKGLDDNSPPSALHPVLDYLETRRGQSHWIWKRATKHERFKITFRRSQEELRKLHGLVKHV